MRSSHPSPGRRLLIAAASASLALATLATTVATADADTGQPAPPAGAVTDRTGEPKHTSDNFATAKQRKQDDLRQKAVAARLNGKKWAQGDVVKFPNGQSVDLSLEETDRIFTVLVEFGDQQFPNPVFQGPPPDGSTTDVTGPLHNEIPEPDRTVDNTTLWQEDYDRAHYENMYFERMREYYETQSSGRYTINGDVTEWVKVPFNEALYGRNYCGSIVCNTSKALVRDALAMWVAAQKTSGMTTQQIYDYLKTFDVEDRYDIDGDHVYDEPDGVIDHFQIVHAGGDEAAGDPNQGTDAIWSHRSGANLQSGGPLGVGVNVGSNGGLVSSSSVPNNPTGMWVYDYTVQPENGGLGVFAHEFGHDLGLPDLYDTSGNTGGAENNTAFWTLMSSGANIGDGGPDGIGDNPTDMSAWERLILGWLEPQGNSGPFYAEVPFGESRDVALGPNTPVTKKPSALVMPLPPHEQDLGAPASGSWQFWSGSGADYETTMTKSVTVAAATPITAKVRYQIEEDWDYAYLEATSDGTTWTPLETNLSTDADPNAQNDGHGITGANRAWVDLTATVPAGTTAIRFRYWTDPYTNGEGFFVDDISLGGQVIGTAETADEGWVFNTRSTGANSSTPLPSFARHQRTLAGVLFDHFYIAEYRQHDGYDASLKTAYNFGFLGTEKDNWVETHPYMEGLLVWYWDTQYTDNNVGDHPGHGELLPVDAHPQFSHWPDGTLMRNRILSYDSTFGLQPTQALSLHLSRFDAEGEYAATMTGTVPSRPGVRTFDDTQQWWFPSDEHTVNGVHPGRYQPGWYSVDVPKTGSSITVNGFGKKGNQINLSVN